MNPLSLGCLAAAALTVSLPASRQARPGALSPEAIVAKHVEAIGGRDALRRVRTMVVRGRNAGLGAHDRAVVRYLKQPNLLRQEAQGDKAFILAACCGS